MFGWIPWTAVCVMTLMLALFLRRRSMLRAKILSALWERGEMSGMDIADELGMGAYGVLREMTNVGELSRRVEKGGSERYVYDHFYYSLPTCRTCKGAKIFKIGLFSDICGDCEGTGRTHPADLERGKEL